ncbi:MAG: exodeoxyribonuclease VII large subunit [Terrimicrobiaceae bacterium]|nr:exodeoxyribonuclease VII large subunit [Terrimicrobiaceae bacterium]
MQLDFDLSGAPRREKPVIWTVSKLTRRVREVLEGGVGEVWVEGEISNLRRQASGHLYFSLKDATSQLACVLFAGQAAQNRGVKLADGLEVQVLGQVTVYEARGQYQLLVRTVQECGAGRLQAQFEELKRRLAAEGLFDSERKRPLPKFPHCVGVVTSPTGAALRDFLHVLHRRHPGIGVIIAPVRVQGRGAAREIAAAVRAFNENPDCGRPDVVVVTRGGGSLEDLWEFNEEVVARAVAESAIPVVSAVGHEIDFTICDFAADVRAPTPSAAAEILAADAVELAAGLRDRAGRLHRCANARIRNLHETLGQLRRTALFTAATRSFFEASQSLDRGSAALERGVRSGLSTRLGQLDRGLAALRARSPHGLIERTAGELRVFLGRIDACCRRRVAEAGSSLERLHAVLGALNPRAALARGYSLTSRPDGSLVRSAGTVASGDVLITHVADGSIRSVVEGGTAD